MSRPRLPPYPEGKNMTDEQKSVSEFVSRDVYEAMLDSQYRAGAAAGWNAAQLPEDEAAKKFAALIKVETGALSALNRSRAALVQAPVQVGETQEFILRAMAHNYGNGPHSWDHLDKECCQKAADEIRYLRSALALPPPDGLHYAAAIAALALPLPVQESAPVAWMHPTANWSHVNYQAIRIHCRNDGPMPIPLYLHPETASVREPGASTHEERIALAKALSWDVTEISPDDVKGILAELAKFGFRLSRLHPEGSTDV